MRMSEGELVVWQAVGSVLAVQEPAELAMLDEIVDTHLRSPSRIGAQPGAFDASDVHVLAVSLYAVAAPAVAAAPPKLFDAVVDVSKDALKKALYRRLGRSGESLGLDDAGLLKIKEAIAVAGAKRRLSDQTIAALTDSVVLEIVAKRVTGNAKTARVKVVVASVMQPEAVSLQRDAQLRSQNRVRG